MWNRENGELIENVLQAPDEKNDGYWGELKYSWVDVSSDDGSIPRGVGICGTKTYSLMFWKLENRD